MSLEWKQPLSVVRGERSPGQRWLHSDLLLQAAFLSHKNMIDGCGHPLDESLDKSNHGPFRTHEYVLDEVRRCYACAAQQRERDKLPKEARGDSSYRVSVKRVRVGSAPND